MRIMTSPTACATPDMRWVALDLVCAVRSVLGLRDHDIATLRGLLSLIGPQGWDGPMMVHASNKVLQARCDGADERSLRRRLAKLVAAGLIQRRQSPNRKRYVLRDAAGEPLAHYGFDLSPLRDALPQLQDMAKAHAAELEARRVARSLLRHRLYEISLTNGDDFDPALLDEARLALRRQVDSEHLHNLLHTLTSVVVTNNVSDTDSQNDRHIESPRQDSSYEPIVEIETQEPKITLDRCLAHLTKTIPFFPTLPRSWEHLHQNALELGQCLGLTSAQIGQACARLGRKGASLALLGLVEAQPRIRNAAGYLARIINDAKRANFDVLRMFRTLTGAGTMFPAGNLRQKVPA